MVNIDATSPQLEILKKVADAIASRDVKKVEPLISKDFAFKTFPKISELPDLNREEYLPRFGEVFGIFSKIDVDFHDVIDAPGKVVTHHSILVTTVGGVTLNYDAAAIFTFIDEDGKLKILECKVFTDPQQRGALYAEGAKALGKGVPVA